MVCLHVELAGDLAIELAERVGDRGQRGGLARRRDRGQHRLGGGPHIIRLLRVDDPVQRFGARRGGQAGEGQAPVEPLRGGDQLGGLPTDVLDGSLAERPDRTEPRAQLGCCLLRGPVVAVGAVAGRLGLGQLDPGLLQRQVDGGVLGSELAGRGVPRGPALLGRLLGGIAHGRGLPGAAQLLGVPLRAFGQAGELPAQLRALSCARRAAATAPSSAAVSAGSPR